MGIVYRDDGQQGFNLSLRPTPEKGFRPKNERRRSRASQAQKPPTLPSPNKSCYKLQPPFLKDNSLLGTIFQVPCQFREGSYPSLASGVFAQGLKTRASGFLQTPRCSLRNDMLIIPKFGGTLKLAPSTFATKRGTGSLS